MFLRFFSFLTLQCVGGLVGGLALWRTLGWFDASSELLSVIVGALVGVVIASWAWFMLDTADAERLLRWLKGDDPLVAQRLRGVWGDLADRVRRELRARDQALRVSDARLQDFLSALQASPNGVVLLDAQARIEWFNQTASAHFGFEVQRDLLQHFSNLVRDPAFAAYYAAQDFQRDVIVPGRDDAPARAVKLAVQLHPYGEGRLLLLSRDITAVEQADAMRRDFVANVSHEIRTPLTVLTGFVETLQSLPLTADERQKYLGLMAQQGERMQTLVSDLLMLSRLEGSPPVGVSDWVSVASLLRQVQADAWALSALLGQGESTAHDFRFDSPPAGDLAGAQSELLSAMTNLVGNAIRYTPAQGQIEVRWLLLPDGRVEFSVKDSGCGIAAEHIPRLTERFYRVDRSRSRDTGGTGLGLAIVKHVAQRHGAELHIESSLGHGSTFSITFPAGRVRDAVNVPVVSEAL